MSELHFSIDLEAEIEKIAQRQALNAVHYLVQLVRKALQEQAHRIEIHINRRSLVFQHDGQPLAHEELQAIADLLLNRHRDFQDHQTLELLERQFGITLLSILLRFERITLKSGDAILIKMGRECTLEMTTTVMPGFYLEVRGKGRVPKEEIRELTFFCAGAKTPIHVNGKPINQPLTLPPVLAKKSFHTKTKRYEGEGEIGLSAEGEYSEFWYFKQGVRAAMKQFSPNYGMVVHGWWNLNSHHQENNFEYTIETGERHMAEQSSFLYARAFDAFPSMSDNAKLRIRKMLFQWTPAEWFIDLNALPMFHSSVQRWSMCLKDLVALNKRYLAIPYASPNGPEASPIFPVLDLEEIHFLTYHLRLPLRRVQDDPHTRQIQDTQGMAIAHEELPQAAQSLLAALDQADPITRHAFHLGRTALQQADLLLLPIDNLRVKTMIERSERDSAHVLLWKYKHLPALKRGY